MTRKKPISWGYLIRGNSIHNYISTESPIGKAIFGHKAGETVKVKVSDDYSYGACDTED